MISTWLGSRFTLIIVAALFSGVFAFWIRGTMADADLAHMAEKHSKEMESLSVAANAAAQKEIERSNLRLAELEVARNEAIILSNNARNDAVAANAAASRLRGQLDTIRSNAISRDPTLANGSPAGASTTELLTHMLRRALDRAEFLAAFADRARIAGLTCERAYEAIRAP